MGVWRVGKCWGLVVILVVRVCGFNSDKFSRVLFIWLWMAWWVEKYRGDECKFIFFVEANCGTRQGNGFDVPLMHSYFRIVYRSLLVLYYYVYHNMLVFWYICFAMLYVSSFLMECAILETIKFFKSQLVTDVWFFVHWMYYSCDYWKTGESKVGRNEVIYAYNMTIVV